MDESNKKRLIRFLKVFGLFLLAFVSIVTSSTVFNLASSGFSIVCAILNLIAEAVGIYFLQRWLMKEEDKPGTKI